MDRKRLNHISCSVFINDTHRCGRDYCDAKEIMSIADAMETNGMKDAGYEYINLDGMVAILVETVGLMILFLDCWADHRDQNGTIVPDMNRFPRYVLK